MALELCRHTFFSFLFIFLTCLHFAKKSSFQNFSSEMSAQLEFFFRTILDSSTFFQRNKFASLAEKNETNFLPFSFSIFVGECRYSFCVARNSLLYFALDDFGCQNKSLEEKLRLANVDLLS